MGNQETTYNTKSSRLLSSCISATLNQTVRRVAFVEWFGGCGDDQGGPEGARKLREGQSMARQRLLDLAAYIVSLLGGI